MVKRSMSGVRESARPYQGADVELRHRVALLTLRAISAVARRLYYVFICA